MLIAVIIPSYNASPYIRHTLDSVLAQTLSIWQLIVVDDGSSDDTPDIVASYAKADARIRLVRQANGGVAAARNRGIAEISPEADYVILLDHDDVWEPDALETLSTAMAADPVYSAAHGVARYIDQQGCLLHPGEAERWTRERRGVRQNRIVSWDPNEPTTFEVQALWNHILTPGQVLIRRTALDTVGSFDPATAPCDDWDMWLRLSRVGPIAFVDRVVLGFRQHSTNASHNRKIMSDADLIVRRKFVFNQEYGDNSRNILLIGYRYSERSTSRVRMHWARECLVQGQLIEAAKQVRHAVRCYARSFGALKEQ